MSEREDLQARTEEHRRELTAHCYRMLGSAFEAEDAVQETMVRAWRSLDGFQGRSSLRSWLYRIATNVCLDALRGRSRRATPVDLGPAGSADTLLAPPDPAHEWVLPVPDAWLPVADDPAQLAESRESIRLAFIAALQHLPPRQRAVLLLREVLRWKAEEVAELLDTSVASVNSALQRGRATLGDSDAALSAAGWDTTPSPDDQALLDRYVDAFERYDIRELVSVIHHDATFTMPPFDMWLRGTRDIAAWYTGQGAACEGSRLLPTSANGTAAFGAYKRAADGGHEPFAIQVIETRDGAITGLHHFLDPRLFPLFGLPARLDPTP
ncbi:MAG: sigma-70 family RNA polymerase sigma factor [Acidimicrobiales bacterium]